LTLAQYTRETVDVWYIARASVIRK